MKGEVDVATVVRLVTAACVSAVAVAFTVIFVGQSLMARHSAEPRSHSEGFRTAD